MTRIILLISALIFTVAACSKSSEQEFATVDGERIALTATLTPGVSGGFILKFNNETVIDDSFPFFAGTTETFNGSYGGEAVSARVTEVNKWFSDYYLVDVFYKGQLLDTLQI